MTTSCLRRLDVQCPHSRLQVICQVSSPEGWSISPWSVPGWVRAILVVISWGGRRGWRSTTAISLLKGRPSLRVSQPSLPDVVTGSTVETTLWRRLLTRSGYCIIFTGTPAWSPLSQFISGIRKWKTPLTHGQNMKVHFLSCSIDAGGLLHPQISQHHLTVIRNHVKHSQCINTPQDTFPLMNATNLNHWENVGMWEAQRARPRHTSLTQLDPVIPSFVLVL